MLFAALLLFANGPVTAGEAPLPSSDSHAASSEVPHAGDHGADLSGHVGAELSDTAMSDEEAMGHTHDESAAGKTFAQRLFKWLGRLHILAIHFPIAMIIGALGIELFGLLRRETSYQHAARIMLIVGALGAVGAASLGWFAGGFTLSDRNPVLMAHRWLGTAIAVLAVVLAYLAVGLRRRPGSRKIYWLLLAGLSIAVSVQGWLGGSFMHGGLRHLAF